MKKNVLITGVLGGIGKSLAYSFKSAGYFVIGLDKRNLDGESDFLDVFYKFDINQFSFGEDYYRLWCLNFKRDIKNLDVLINNAATQILGSLSTLNLDDWNETLRVNLTGPLLLSKFFSQNLEDNNGSIINIGSIHHNLTKPSFISYATSKSALIGLTKAMAVDLSGKIRVNAISPAAIETEMLKAGFNNDESAIDELRKIHPVQRIGYPNDVAKMALFLASENSGFIHGANLSLDGGISSVLKDL